MKTILTFMLLLFGSTFFLTAYGQTSLGGMVFDKDTGDPILFASVALYQNDVLKTGTVTDSLGRYLFSNIDPGTYKIQISYLGYANQCFPKAKALAGKHNIYDTELRQFTFDFQPVIVTSTSPSKNYWTQCRYTVKTEPPKNINIHFDWELKAANCYPNPSSGITTLELYQDIDQLTIFDINGRLVSQAKNLAEGKHMINGENWLPGTYILDMRIGQEHRHLKLIIQSE